MYTVGLKFNWTLLTVHQGYCGMKQTFLFNCMCEVVKNTVCSLLPLPWFVWMPPVSPTIAVAPSAQMLAQRKGQLNILMKIVLTLWILRSSWQPPGTHKPYSVECLNEQGLQVALIKATFSLQWFLGPAPFIAVFDYVESIMYIFKLNLNHS